MKNKLFLKKMNSFLFLSVALMVLLFSEIGFGQTTVFSENMGTATSTTTIAANVFQQSSTLTYSNGGQTSSADVRATSVSSTYSGFSAGANVFFSTTSGNYGFSIESINASMFSSLNLQFGYRKENASLHAAFSVDYWNGSSWITVANTSSTLFNEAVSAAAGWYLSKNISLPVGSQINVLKIRFVKSGTASIRIDDVKLTGIASSVGTQLITFGAIPTKTYGDADFSPGATSASSGTNQITYVSSNTAVATIISGNILFLIIVFKIQ